MNRISIFAGVALYAALLGAGVSSADEAEVRPMEPVGEPVRIDVPKGDDASGRSTFRLNSFDLNDEYADRQHYLKPPTDEFQGQSNVQAAMDLVSGANTIYIGVADGGFWLPDQSTIPSVRLMMALTDGLQDKDL